MLPTNTIVGLLWWSGFTVVAIWAQRFVPGVDFLAPGLVLAMQEERGRQPLLLAVIWVLVQEGMGNMPFGYVVASYGLLAAFYMVGRWLFEARSLLFMCLLGVGLGVVHPVLLSALASLGDLTVPLKAATIQGVVQAVAFPLVWAAADRLYPKVLRLDVKPL